MSKKLCFLISVIIVLSLAAPAAADELLASYEDSEMADLTIVMHPAMDPTLTVTRVLGGVSGAPAAPNGVYILKWVWNDEPLDWMGKLAIEIEQNWATKAFDLAPYNLITADVWFDDANAQPATIGVYDTNDVTGWPQRHKQSLRFQIREFGG